MTTRYTIRSGKAMLEVSDGLADVVRASLDQVGSVSLRLLQGAAEDTAREAESTWYGSDGVRRESGKSGDIEVVTQLSDDQARVSVGSVDLDKAKFVHRAGALALDSVEISDAEYYRERRHGRPASVYHARADRPQDGVVAGRYYRLVPSKRASDGRFLLPMLVTTPMRKRVTAILPEIARATAKIRGGG